MAYYEEVPVEVKELSREKRIQFYRRKIQSQIPAFDLLDRLDTGLTPEQIREELEKLRKVQTTVIGYIRLMESKAFNNISVNLEQTVLAAKRVLAENGELLLQQFRGELKSPQRLPEVSRLREQAIKDVHEVEYRLVALCKHFCVDPAPLLRSDELESENPNVALAARKTRLPEECVDKGRSRRSIRQIINSKSKR